MGETVGESTVMKGVEMAKRWWAGAGDAQSFIAAQPAKLVAAIDARGGEHHRYASRSVVRTAERLESTQV